MLTVEDVIFISTGPRLVVLHGFVSCDVVTGGSLMNSNSLFSILTAIFPGEPGLASFIGAKGDGSGVVVTSGAIRYAKFQ